MAQGELWSTLVTAIDPGNIRAMPAVLQSTIDLLETELARARAALKEIQPDTAPILIPGDELAAGAIAAYRRNLIARASDFYYGSRRLSPKEVGLVPVIQEVQSDEEEDKESRQKLNDIIIETPPKQVSLVDVLSNSLILDHMAPYLSVPTLFALASTSHVLRTVIMKTPYIFRHLDLTQGPGHWLPSNSSRSSEAGISSNESLENSLTEDAPYSVPLQRIIAGLGRSSILQDVRTLILDGLSVPAELVAELILTDRFNVNLLSIRECRHLNERKLIQVLQHAVRPSRPKGAPRVKGIYYFTPMTQPRAMMRSRYRDWWSSRCTPPTSNGVLETKEGPPSSDDTRESALYYQNAWYRPSGKLIPRSIDEGWAHTIQQCQGIISFDAVLCRGPRHNVDLYTSLEHDEDGYRPEGQPLGPAIATVALGPRGCDGCRTSPEGPAVWGESPERQFPLLAPLPLHSSSVAVAKRPVLFPDVHPILVARCAECLTDRWCRRCNKWFCTNCLPSPERVRTNLSPHQTAVRGPRASQDTSLSHERRRLLGMRTNGNALPAKPNANEHVRIAKENIVLIIMKVALLQCVTGVTQVHVINLDSSIDVGVS
ncbi:hypothetical protein AFGD_010302 [Aspergillus flavus]|uniref:Ubiquitin fusion degradation protein (Ufd1) n=1 Tax=Aspergillus flavus TaxID=5059 RepID=A0AB74CE65_ASPFL|nr:hypothetical protein AFGD_010302 [Aspergillus flavus]RMZ44659.1 hypothetical protein CA14_012448 [Aspergillus flavus]